MVSVPADCTLDEALTLISEGAILGHGDVYQIAADVIDHQIKSGEYSNWAATALAVGVAKEQDSVHARPGSPSRLCRACATRDRRTTGTDPDSGFGCRPCPCPARRRRVRRRGQ